MAVIIIESPNKVEKIRHYSGMKVLATRGHFKDLPSKELGVDLANNFQPTFKLNFGALELVKTLQAAAKGQTVYIATDPDREGYAIGMFVYEEIKRVAKDCQRLEIHEVTAAGVKQALADAIPFQHSNLKTFDAFLGRRVSDRLVGFIMSPIANREILRDKDTSFSVGRVQSPAVRLVVDLEDEIRNFKPSTFWTLSLELEKGKPFTAKHRHGNFKKKDSADVAMAAIKSAKTATVETVESREVKQWPKAPFSTVDLQTAASAQLGLSPSRAMRLAQDLFEHGLITYIRTDSVRLAPEFIKAIRTFVHKSFGNDFLPPRPIAHKSKRSQADAHEGIRPTKMHALAACAPIVFGEKLSSQHLKLYELIYKRAVASQMAPALANVTTVGLDCNGEKFTATGRIGTFDGFTRLWKDSQEERALDGVVDQDDATQALPNLVVGESVKKLSAEMKEKQTTPPDRFTEAGLVKKLESLGIGRPSTYASICQTICAKNYVSLVKRQLVPTPAGEALIGYLKTAHSWVIDYALTEKMEGRLDHVEDGTEPGGWQAVVRSLHEQMGATDPSVRGSLPISVNMIRFAKTLEQQTGIEMPVGAEESQAVLSSYIRDAKKVAAEAQAAKMSVVPLSAAQLAVIEKHGTTKVQKAVEAGDFNAGRKFLDKHFRKLDKEKKAAAQTKSTKPKWLKTKKTTFKR